MYYAIIKDGECLNTIEWDGISEWSPPEGTTLVELDELGRPFIGLSCPIIEEEYYG